MYNCDPELLQNYVSGPLTESETARCEQHLVKCTSCRSRVAVLVRVLNEDLPPEEIVIIDSAEASLSSRVPPPKRFPASVVGPRTRWTIWPNWQFAGIAACAVLLISAGLGFFSARSGRITVEAPYERIFEGRLSGQAYSEYIRTRSVPKENESPSATRLQELSGEDLKLGRFYLLQSDFKQAIAHLQVAEQQEPSLPQIHNDLGVAYLESSLDAPVLQRALQEFQTALQLNSSYEPALFNIALAYERLGRFEDADRYLKMYLELDPNSSWAKEVRSKL